MTTPRALVVLLLVLFLPCQAASADDSWRYAPWVGRFEQVGGQVTHSLHWDGACASLTHQRNVRAALAVLPPEGVAELCLPFSDVTDDDLANVSLPKDLRVLDLSYTDLDGSSLAKLGSLSELRTLDLSYTHVDDAALKVLPKLPLLEALGLFGTPITDVGAGAIRDLPRLKYLGVSTQRAQHKLREPWSLTYYEVRQAAGGVSTAFIQKAAKQSPCQKLFANPPNSHEPIHDWLAQAWVNPEHTYAVLEHCGGTLDFRQWIQDVPMARTLFLAPDTTDRDLAEAEALTRLEILDLGGCRQIPDNGLRALEKMPELMALNLDGTLVTSAALRHLHKQKKLQALAIGKQITDGGLAHLKRLRDLRVLFIANRQVSSQGLGYLKALPRLTRIYFARSRGEPGLPVRLYESILPRVAIGQVDAQALWRPLVVGGPAGDRRNTLLDSAISARLESELQSQNAYRQRNFLRDFRGELTLSGAQFTNDDVLELKNLPEIRELNLTASSVDDAGLSVLAELNNLVSLNLASTRLTDRALGYLRELSELRKLHLDHTAVSDVGMRDLAALKGLEELSLRATRITDEGLRELAGLKNLRVLRLNFDDIGDRGVEQLKGCRKLEVLSLGDTRVSDQSLAVIAAFKQLRVLDLSLTRVTSASFEQLRALPKLEELSLAGTRVNDEAISSALKFTQLKQLSVFGTGMTDAGVRRLRTGLPTVEIAYEPTEKLEASLTARRPAP